MTAPKKTTRSKPNPETPPETPPEQLEAVEPVAVSLGGDGGPDFDPNEFYTDDIAGPGDYDPETNDDLLGGAVICSREEFRTWYAGRFHLANMILAPFVGGPLQALDLDETNTMVQRAADGLYDEAKRKKWRFLLKKPSGTWPMIETQGGLFFAVISEAAAEIAARRAALAAAQANHETQGTGKGTGGSSTVTQEDLDRQYDAHPRDENGNRIYRG